MKPSKLQKMKQRRQNSKILRLPRINLIPIISKLNKKRSIKFHKIKQRHRIKQIAHKIRLRRIKPI
jgi:hypothetical protein